MPLHRKRTHRPMIVAAALGVGATVSGVAYAAQVGQMSLISAPDPVPVTSAPPSPTSPTSPATTVPEPVRAAPPSRSAPTDRAGLRAKKDRDRSEGKDRRGKPGAAEPRRAETSETAAPTPETTSETPEQDPGSTVTQNSGPASRARASQTAILQGTNAARANAGLAPLGTSSCLTGMAQRQAERLATAGTLYHQDLGAVMSSCGMSSAGENVAMNSTRPADMVGQWLNSPGHRANMLNGRFSLIGVGVAQAGDGAWYGVQVFGDS